MNEWEQTTCLRRDGIRRIIEETIGGRIDVVDTPVIQIEGEGASTGRLIELTDMLVKKANVLYQNVWIVFDKDDFWDFDQAIEESGTQNAGWPGSTKRNAVLQRMIRELRYICLWKSC